MRIFGRAKDRGSSAGFPAAAAHDLASSEEHVLPELARTEEMPIVREVPTLPAVQAADVVGVVPDVEGDSDVFVVRRSSPELPALSAEALAAAAAAAEGVTLFVYGWENVQPGPLSWAFPSLHTALQAVRTMRNAVEWCIVRGREPSIDAARAKGAILIEQNA
jgi:hypothetical protein